MLKNLEVMMEVLADSRKIGRNSALLITLNELKLFKIFKTVDQHKKNLILLKQIFMRNEGHNASLYTAESAFILTKYFEIFENLDEKIENRLKLPFFAEYDSRKVILHGIAQQAHKNFFESKVINF